MTAQPAHLMALEEIEREGIPGLVEVLREEGLDAAACESEPFLGSWCRLGCQGYVDAYLSILGGIENQPHLRIVTL